MKKCILWSAIGLLCVTPLLAQPQSTSAALVSSGPPLFQDSKETRFLFISLTAEQVHEAEGLLELRVSLNDKSYIEETLSLEAARGTKEPSFELLATRPDLLDRLYTLSRDKENRITVEVLLDGAEIRELSFDELLRDNRQLKAKPFYPVSAPSRVRDLSESGSPEPLALITANGMQHDPSCVDACTQQYYLCTGNNCYEDSDPNCVWCQSEYASCIDSCPYVCVDPKSVREETRTEEVSSISYGLSCYSSGGSYPPWGSYYEHLLKQYRHTRVRITEYCDGSTSEAVLSTWYSSRTCGEPIGYPCYGASGPFSGWYC